MSKVLISDTTMTAIADAIRAKNGSSATMLPSEMPTAITNINTKYKPRAISFQNYDGSSLLSETRNLDTSLLTDMTNMFAYSPNLYEIDVADWDTSNVRSFWQMFSNTHVDTTLNVSRWNTGNVTTMRDMFSTCPALTSFYAPNWNVENVTNTYKMFNSCTALYHINIDNWNLSSVMEFGSMFGNCPNLAQDAIDSILLMCSRITHTTTSSKTFKNLGLQPHNAKLRVSPNLQAAIDAGWNYGY